YGFGVGVGSSTRVNDLAGNSSSFQFFNYGVSAGFTANSTYYGASWSQNWYYGGNSNQGVGAIGLQFGDFGFRLDEDFLWDGGDRHRTGGMLATYRLNDNVTLAFGASMMTGQADEKADRHLFGHPDPKLGTYKAEFETNIHRAGI